MLKNLFFQWPVASSWPPAEKFSRRQNSALAKSKAVSARAEMIGLTTKGKLNMKTTNTKRMVTAAMIAAAYTAVSLVLLPLSFGPVQVRVSEALTLLTVFSPTAVTGVTLGCALTNAIGLATGANIIGIPDIIFGTAATLVAAILSWKLRKIRFCGLPIASCLPPVIVNALVIGGELTYVGSAGFPLPIFLINAAQVALGQIASCCVIGLLMVYFMEKKGLDKKIFAER